MREADFGEFGKKATAGPTTAPQGGAAANPRKKTATSLSTLKMKSRISRELCPFAWKTCRLVNFPREPRGIDSKMSP